jgi:hypothetical protein
MSVASVARMYDYYLGGSENTDVDREAARLVLGAAPDVPLAALENREFLKHAVRFLVGEAGISQFIDIGPGLPTRGNVHQIVRQHDQHARVVYVDNDHGKPGCTHAPQARIMRVGACESTQNGIGGHDRGPGAPA